MDNTDQFLRRAEPSALVALDGTVRSLNGAMVAILDCPAEDCMGRRAADLLPDRQGVAIGDLVAHTAATKRLAMRVLEFPGAGRAPVICLVEARAVTHTGGRQEVWVRTRDMRDDLGGLLIPFRMAAQAADLGLCTYAPRDGQFEWHGGAPRLSALFPVNPLPLSWVTEHIHEADRQTLEELLNPDSAQSPWARLRFRTEHGDWRHLTCQTRRIQLGHDGSERLFALIRDDTQRESHQQRMLAALGAERQRTDETAAFSSALIAATTEDELRQVILTHLAAAFHGAGALLAFVDDGRLHVSSDAGIPLPLADVAQNVPLDTPTPLLDAIRSGTPQFIADRAEYLRRWPQGISEPWLGRDAALSITPLSPSGDQPLGAWLVFHDRAHRLAADERALMVTLSNLAGQALKRIRAQQAQVELATAVQHSMLPALPEQLPGLQIAARYQGSCAGLDVGGDWYDAFETPDGAVALVIGDVQGHDVDAAAFMGQVRASMRAIAAHAPDPGTVLAHTNELLVTMDVARFATCTMLYVDPRDGKVTGASAGHVPLVCAYDDGGYDIRPLRCGTPLGILPEAAYPLEEFTLDENAALVMVTDGAVEGPLVTLESGLKYAATRAAQALRDGLSTGRTADRVLAAAAHVDQRDDVAVLVARRRHLDHASSAGVVSG